MRKFTTWLICLSVFSISLKAQPAGWNNHSCAVVLTYDDGLNVHLDKVIPSLDSFNLKGTFYIPGNAATINSRMQNWKDAALSGHELGNHTLFHPCAGSLQGRSWVNPDYDLDRYSLRRFMDEVKVTNTILRMIDGKEIRTFAYTCGDMKAGSESFYEPIQGEFPSARGVISRFEKQQNTDLYNMGAFMMNGQSADEMIGLVKKAMETNTLLVFLFHGVGGEHNLNVSLRDHNELLRFLKKNEKQIWVPTFLEVSEYLRQTGNK